MHQLRRFARYAFARVRRNNPERLWVHYAVALAIIFGLLAATHSVNRVIIDTGVTAASTIKRGNEQIQTAQDIITLSDDIAKRTSFDLNALDDLRVAFAQNHAAIIASGLWSQALQDHYYGAVALDRKVKDFLTLTEELQDATPLQRPGIVIRLEQVYAIENFRADLSRAATLIEAEAAANAAYLARLQEYMLAASALTLLIEAIFIFLPAQLTVNTAIRSFRNQTRALEHSQAELQQLNDSLEHIVSHDPLTGLPNRSRLMSYLKTATSSKVSTDFGVLFIGLDNFKAVNDSAGHDYGDALLKAVADALRSCVDDDHIVARVGGDEFVLVTDEPPEDLVKRVNASLEEPFEVMGRRLPISASIGYLEIGKEMNDPLAIFANAGIALQAAKNNGGARALAFTQNLREEADIMQRMQTDLVDAIRNGEIEPWFQPQIWLADGSLHGVEVLARWRHPTCGLLAPDKFLPAAERAGLMVEMDHEIWRSAMQCAVDWQKSDLWRPCISLNAAPDTISDPYLVERFLLQLQRAGLDSDQVVIEVLETTLIDGSDDMAAINIDSLAECGIALELDDFGTGYASLSKLTQLPLAGLKLDRSLVAPLPDQGADSIVRAVLALSAELGLHVVAEGIEEEIQATHLGDLGCAIGQGYGFGRPMPPVEFEAWLRQHAGQKLHARPNVA